MGLRASGLRESWSLGFAIRGQRGIKPVPCVSSRTAGERGLTAADERALTAADERGLTAAGERGLTAADERGLTAGLLWHDHGRDG